MKLNTFIVVSLVPALLVVCVFYFLDKNKEPVKMVLKAFFWGMFSVVITIMLYIILPSSNLVRDGSILNSLVEAFYDASLHEELAKLIAIIFGVYKLKDFDEWYDGMLYGISIGVGFAFIENIQYFYNFYTEIGYQIYIDRNIYSMPVHAMLGAMMGFYVSKAKFTSIETKEIEYWSLAFIVPFFIHGLYDFVLILKDINISWTATPLIIIMLFKVLEHKKISQTSVIE